ncbi:MAG TPA: PAS domain S-box protein, partial [Armatimonadetes bacterium]|nr:PAS domain S-box protein [Armatimonadota bacterium]
FIALTAHDMRDAVMHREQQTRLYRRLEAMYGIAAALSELTDLDEILDRGLELSMQALNADCGRIYMLDDGGTLHLVRYRGISDEFAEAVAELRYGVGNVGTVAKTLRPSLVNYATSQSQHRDACLAEGLCCSAFAALKIGDKVYGVVAFSYRRPLDWTNEEMSLLEAVGEELGVAIQRAQLYDRLRTSREWYRNLFLLASDGIWVLDADGNILDANRALEQAMRVPMGDLRGKSVYEFLEASHIDAVRRWLDDILRGEQFKPQQLTLRIDGGARTFEVHGARITDAMGKPLALCILHDITTRVRHAQMREALDSIRARIERQRSVETMLMTLTEYLASELHWFNALLLFKPASAQVEKLVVAWHQECEHGGTGVRRLIIGEPQLTTALLSECFRAMQMRKPLVLHRSSDAVREFMERCGLSTPDDTSIFSLS